LTSGLSIAELIDSDHTQGETLPFLVFLDGFQFLDHVTIEEATSKNYIATISLVFVITNVVL